MTEQVICVDDSYPRGREYWRNDPVVKGKIYTVREWSVGAGTTPGVLLCEVSAGILKKDPYTGVEIVYRADRFRPTTEQKGMVNEIAYSL